MANNVDQLPTIEVEGKMPAIPIPVPPPSFATLGPDPERAELIVQGRSYSAWETVAVQRQVAEMIQFRFTASEGSDAIGAFQDIKITPGDPCEIYLAGQLACTGFVTETQRYYDANRHSLLVAGHSMAMDTALGSIMGGSGQFRNQSFTDIAKEVLAPFGVSLNVVGNPAELQKKFENVQVAYGESPWELLDRLARMRGAYLGDNSKGQLEAVCGLAGGSAGSLIEGKNILEARASVVDYSLVGPVVQVSGQGVGNDQHNMATVAQPVGQAQGQSTRYRPFRMIAELPTWNVADLRRRAQYEIQWRATEWITAEITVTTWLTTGGLLWAPNMTTLIDSPMLLLNEIMGIWSVVYSQDSGGGTRTVITTKNAAAWGAGAVQVNQ
jgi:prophage tail gpP-like protein